MIEGKAAGPSQYVTGSSRRGRIEHVGLGLKTLCELEIVIGAGDGGSAAQMLGGLLRIATRAVELAESHVTVREIWELREELPRHALGLVETAVVNQVDRAV